MTERGIIPVIMTATFFANGFEEELTYTSACEVAMLMPQEENLSTPIFPVEGNLVLANPKRQKDTGKIYKLSEKKDLKKNICNFPEPSISEVDRVVKLAGKGKARACIVVVEPSIPIIIPVVVLDEEKARLMNLNSCSCVKICFEPKDPEGKHTAPEPPPEEVAPTDKISALGHKIQDLRKDNELYLKSDYSTGAPNIYKPTASFEDIAFSPIHSDRELKTISPYVATNKPHQLRNGDTYNGPQREEKYDFESTARDSDFLDGDTNDRVPFPPISEVAGTPSAQSVIPTPSPTEGGPKDYFDTDTQSEAPPKPASIVKDVASFKSEQPKDKQPLPEIPMKEKSLMSSLFDNLSSVIKPLVSKSIVQSDMNEIIFCEEVDWTADSSRFLTYKQAVLIYQRAESLPYIDVKREVSVIGNILCDYMKMHHFKVDLLFLAFAAIVYNKQIWTYQWDGKRLRDMRTCILTCIENYNPHDYTGPKMTDLKVMRGTFSPCEGLNNSLRDILITDNSGICSNTITRILWIIFYHCDRKIDWLRLHNLNPRVFFDSQQSTLKIFLNEGQLWHLGLSIQNTLEDFCLVCLTYVQDCISAGKVAQKLVVPQGLSSRLVELIKAEICTVQKGTSGRWKLFVDALANLQFETYDKASRGKVVNAAATQLSFRKCRTFINIDSMFSTVSVDHPHYGLFRTAVFKSICSDLAHSRYNSFPFVEAHNFIALLKLSVGKLLANEEGVVAVKAYALYSIRHSSSFKKKLKFIADLYRYFVADQWAPVPRIFEVEVIQTCFDDALLCKEDPATIIFQSFSVAKDPSVFVLPDATEGNVMLGWFAKKIISNQVASHVIKIPKCLANIKILTSNEVSGSLMSFLLEELRAGLKNQCKGIKQAAEFYSYLVFDKNRPECAISGIAKDVLVSSFNKWNPLSIVDVLALGATPLLKIFGCLVDLERGLGTKSCLDKLKGLILDWQKSFETNEITFSETDFMLSSFDEPAWEVMGSIADVHLPVRDSLTLKVTKFTETQESISDSLSVAHGDSSCQQSIQSVFQGYNVIAEKGSDLSRILEEYSWMFQKLQTKELALISSEAKTNEHTFLSIMRHDAAVISSFAKDNEEVICAAGFFLRSPSIIFRDALGFGTWDVLSIDSFFTRVNKVKEALQELFMETATFKAVKVAANLVGLSKNSLPEDILTLSDCPGFNILEDNREQFMIAAKLSEISPSLQGFSNGCVQFHFFFAKGDPAFLQLSNTIDELTSERALNWSIKECIEVAKNIYQFLGGRRGQKGWSQCLQKFNERVSISDLLEVMDFFQPALLLLSELSLCSDVWTLAREMKWFGESGWKRFYAEYDNVTNVLLGSLSFEMSVLNSLEPSVRCISFIGSLIKTKTMQDFLGLLCSSSVVQNGGLSDLHVVQQNISSVREWFTTGLDDMAAIFGTFQSVCKTGYYTACETSSDPSESGPGSRLCLKYQKDRSISALDTDIASLDGNHLNDFVQKLGFIQHESESVSQGIKQFIDQHQTLARAVDLMAVMIDIGFKNVDILKFSYKINENTFSDAELLLRDSHEKWMNCDVWLATIRKENRLSLLFWMEELREMHSWLINMEFEDMKAEGNISVQSKLVCALSRIVPQNSPKKSDEIENAVKSTYTVRQKDFRQNAKSWLLVMSNFIESLHESLGTPRPFQGSSIKSKITIHSLNCDEKKESVCLLLKHIYLVRPCMDLFLP